MHERMRVCIRTPGSRNVRQTQNSTRRYLPNTADARMRTRAGACTCAHTHIPPCPVQQQQQARFRPTASPSCTWATVGGGQDGRGFGRRDQLRRSEIHAAPGHVRRAVTPLNPRSTGHCAPSCRASAGEPMAQCSFEACGFDGHHRDPLCVRG